MVFGLGSWVLGFRTWVLGFSNRRLWLRGFAASSDGKPEAFRTGSGKAA